MSRPSKNELTPQVPLIIFDIDGTLADLTHRLHFIEKKPKDWRGFHNACGSDKPIKSIVDLYRTLKKDFEIYFFTGRPERTRMMTYCWIIHNCLEENDPCLTFPAIFANKIIMRKDEDKRLDYVVKNSMYHSLPDYDKERLVCVFDDRQGVVDMWRRNGVKCLQVAKGDY